MKQAIVVRTDLKMGKGKICSQVAHASLFSALKVKRKHPSWFRIWIISGGKKVVLKVKSLKELKEIKEKADELKIPNEIITDAGYTQIPPGSITALGIGPAPDEEIDKITGKLKLL